MDSATTLPVESQNQIVHGHLGVCINLNIEKGIKQMTKYTDEKARKPNVRAYAVLSRSTCLLVLLPVNTSSYKVKEWLIKIMIPVRNSRCVVLGRLVGLFGVSVQPYLMMMRDGQCRNFLVTHVSERLVSRSKVTSTSYGVIVVFMTALGFLVPI